MFDRYNIRNLKRLINDPELIEGELRRIKRDIIKYALTIDSYYYSLTAPTDRVGIMNEDWDNLLILDGARYDIFSNKYGSTVDVDQKLSKGCWSGEFINKNFDGEFHDTVYITANPHVRQVTNGTFHAVINLLEEQWNPEYRTVLPEDVVKVSLSKQKQYSSKRLLIHFMQPHFPFISDSSTEIYQQGLEGHLPEERKKKAPNPWFDILWGSKNDPGSVIEAYISNYDVVVPKAISLANDLNGKSIITSDHGNLIGERLLPIPIRGYGHPTNLHKRELLTVPWIEFESNNRPDIISEQPSNNENTALRVKDEQLRALGYMDDTTSENSTKLG